MKEGILTNTHTLTVISHTLTHEQGPKLILFNPHTPGQSHIQSKMSSSHKHKIPLTVDRHTHTQPQVEYNPQMPTLTQGKDYFS